jgi:hypothetical protein
LAEAISELLNAPVFDLASLPEPSVAGDFDLLAIGTPVIDMRPTPEVQSFVKHLPEFTGKKAILFCTYAIRQGGTLKVLEKELTQKGYSTILCVSKRGLKQSRFLRCFGENKQGIGKINDCIDLLV